MVKRGLFILMSVLCFVSCGGSPASRDSGRSKPVAKVGKHKLDRNTVEEMIPNGISQEDSLSLALQYINAWARDLIFLNMAESQLSKSQQDVSKELEEYRISLLKYRYEQMYINERLDTNISQQEIVKYYEANQNRFILDAPIVKARFLNIAEDSPNIEIIKRKMSSYRVGDVMEADSLAYSSALKYIDWSDTWIDAVSLAREFGTDYVSMLSRMKRNFIEIPDGRGNVKIAYVTDMMREGKRAPLEYCTPRIKDIILSARKHKLISNLERDLLEDALAKHKFVIY